MALSKIDGTNLISPTIPVASGGTGLTSGFVNGLDGWSSSSGNILSSDASKGIYLGTSSVNSAKLLDDYETGTWTPVVNSASGFSTGITSSSNAKYIKVGEIVTVQAYFQMGNSSGNLALEDNVTVTGIPFTAANTEASSCSAYRYNSNNGIFAVYLNATSSIFIRCQQVNGSAPRNGGAIALNYTYQTT